MRRDLRLAIGNGDRRLCHIARPASTVALKLPKHPFSSFVRTHRNILSIRTQKAQTNEKGNTGSELTGKGNGAGNGKDAGFAAEITELAVGITGDDFAAVAAEEFESEFGGVD